MAMKTHFVAIMITRRRACKPKNKNKKAQQRNPRISSHQWSPVKQLHGHN